MTYEWVILTPVNNSPWREVTTDQRLDLSRADDDPNGPSAVELARASAAEETLHALTFRADGTPHHGGGTMIPYDNTNDDTSIFARDDRSPGESLDAFERWRADPENPIWRQRSGIPERVAREATRWRTGVGVDHRTMDERGRFTVPTKNDVLGPGGARAAPRTTEDAWIAGQLDQMARDEAADNETPRDFVRRFRQQRHVPR